jgi:glycosyltransferase involved in cell wall biosynthesis
VSKAVFNKTDISQVPAEVARMEPVNTPLTQEAGWLDARANGQVEPIRLVKVMTTFAAGGTEGQVANLARRIDRSRFDLRFACLRKWGFYLDEIEQRKIPVSEYPVKSFFSPVTLLQQARFGRDLRAEKIQIVHSYNFYSNVFAVPAAKMAGVPLVIASIRDQGVYLNSMQKRAQKWACGFADLILVNAKSISDWLLEEGYEPSKIRIIRNGIDLTRYGEGSNSPALRAELGLPKDAPLVLMLSRLNPQKGVDDFIKAAAMVRLQRPDVRFLLIGEKLKYQDGGFGLDAGYHNYLHELCMNLGLQDHIVFTGHRSDVPALLAEGCVSVLPTHSEGLSNTLLESMAAGLPIVATKVGGNGELVEDGVNGILVPPQAPATLANAILRILDDKALADRFSAAARAKANAYFSMEKMVGDTESLYFEQLRARRG